MMWAKYGQENMANMKLHGNFGVGFKRWKSTDKGTDCLIFYPVDMKTTTSKPVTPYNNVEKVRKGYKMEMGGSMITHRHVRGLRPNAPLDPCFAKGEKKLIPMVFVHGGMVCAAEHCGAAM